MKRKVKRYDEGGGIFGGIKEGLSKVFRRDEDSPKFSDLKSVGGAERRQKTIEEQIKGSGREERLAAMEGKEYAPYRRAPEPEKGSTLKPEPPKGSTTYTNEDYSGDKKAIERDVMDVKPEKESKPAKSIKAAPAPKAAPKIEAKKSIGEDLKPAPAKPSAKKEEQPLPGKPEAKAKTSEDYKDIPVRKIGKAIEDTVKQSGKSISPRKIQEEHRNIVMEKRERTKSYPEFPSKEDKPPLKSLLKEDKPKESSNYISPKKIQEQRSRIAIKKRESDKAALENRKEYGMKKGGSVSSASKRADGIAMRGKTKGRIY
jgi:hypothetical protein